MGCVSSSAKNNILTSTPKETIETIKTKDEINKIDGIKQKSNIDSKNVTSYIYMTPAPNT
jgi:hypothetical protein